MPAIIALLCGVALAACACAIPTVGAVTNAEFYDMIKDYIDDVEITDAFDDQSEDIDAEDDDVITLPGGSDDELDVAYLVEKLGLSDNEKAPRQVGWLHHHHHHHHHHSKLRCRCHHDGCGCCLTHTFSMHLGYRKYKFKLHACITANYLRSNKGFEITFKVNGHVLYHHELSLKHPPKLCFGVPGMHRYGRVCLEFYNINLRSKHVCVRLTGVIDIKIRKFHVHLKLGCFTIPILKEKALEELLNNRAVVQVDVKTSDDTDEPIPRYIEEEHGFSDVTDMFRQLRQQLENDNDPE